MAHLIAKNKLLFIISSAVVGSLLFLGLETIAASNSSISFKKDSNRLFVITFKDPEGIAAFSLKPSSGKPAYGGEIGGCPTLRVLDNVGFFEDPGDFTPEMIAVITDCAGNEEELSIPPPKEGVTKSSVKKSKEEVQAPAPKPKDKEVAGGGVGVGVKISVEKKDIAEARKAEIKYPVQELGNCKSESACRNYCEDTANIKACITFAEKHELISKKDVEKGKKFIAVLDSGGGPGGCKSETECQTYCEGSDKADECLAFAEKHGFMSEEELATNKRMLALVKSGQTPGGCKTKAQCEVYCSNSDNMEVCLDFAEKNNVMPPEELALAKKFLPLMKSGGTPGGCKSKGQCESYCETPEHMRECIAFAEKTGVMPPEELEEAKKVLPYLEKGETPGGCKSKVQCETYCEAEGNFEECVAFGEKAGFISKEEAEAIKKAGGRGPGGCRSKEQCETFCQDPAHIEECIDFGIKAGFVTEEDAKIMRKAGGKGPGDCRSKEDCESYCQDKEHSGECTDFAVKAGFMSPEQGELIKQLGCSSRGECEEICQLPENKNKCQAIINMVGSGDMTGGGMMGGGMAGFSGPGGCKSREECETYCRENPEGCKSFFGGGTGGSGGVFDGSPGSFGGPGGCKTPEECIAYCKDHQEECKNFAPPDGITGDGFPGSGATGGQFPGSGATGGGFPGGPGGCQNLQECVAYCTAHYTDSACTQYIGGGGGMPFLPPPSRQSCFPPPSGLVNWFKGDSISGTFVGGVSIVSGKVGNAFKFDGSSGSVKMGNQANLNFGTEPFSLEAWFNWDGGGSNINNIIRKSNYPPSGPGSGYWLRISKDSTLIEFSVGATTGPVGQSIITAPVNAGAWHHVVATRDSSDAIKLYVDGESRGVIIRQASKAESTSEAPFTLGAWEDRFGLTEFFSGLIDEVSIYDRALSAEEVKSIFNAGSNGKCSVSSGTSGSFPAPPTQYPPLDQGMNLIPQDYQVDCKLFEITPSCSYLGSSGNQAYDLCKKCFPNK